MKLKTVEIEGTTYAEVQDGKPVYVDGEKELPMDVPGRQDQDARLGGQGSRPRRRRRRR